MRWQVQDLGGEKSGWKYFGPCAFSKSDQFCGVLEKTVITLWKWMPRWMETEE